jgi:hypothetical protein
MDDRTSDRVCFKLKKRHLTEMLGHELLEFVVGIARLFLEYMLPLMIEYKISTVLVGGKGGFGIVALG